MINVNCKKGMCLVCSIVLVLSLTNSANASENDVTGRTYAMYFLAFPANAIRDISEMDVTFEADDRVSATDINGHGLYFAGPGFVIGTLLAVHINDDLEKMVIFATMAGITNDHLITGVGFFLINNAKIIPYVFTGILTSS